MASLMSIFGVNDKPPAKKSKTTVQKKSQFTPSNETNENFDQENNPN